MGNTPRHPNKEIRKAIEYAVEYGWRVEKAGARAHAWGFLYCLFAQRGGCRIPVWSTPRVPESHAKDIRREVDNCPHSR